MTDYLAPSPPLVAPEIPAQRMRGVRLPKAGLYRVLGLALGLLELATMAILSVAFVLALPMAALTLAQLRFGYHSYTLSASSMGDTLPQGSLVITHPVSVGGLVTGDVIAFYPPHQQSLATERVISLMDKGLTRVIVTKADTAISTRTWLLATNVEIDREVLYVPMVGNAATEVQKPASRLALLALPIALFLLLGSFQRLHTTARRRSRGD